MKRKNPIEFKCNKCGAPQPSNNEKSNMNWDVFDCNAKCQCGGEFVMWLNGEPLKPYVTQAGEGVEQDG